MKWLYRIFYYIVPLVLVGVFFGNNQPARVSIGFGGILVALAIWRVYMKRLGEIKARKEQAIENAQNQSVESNVKTLYTVVILNAISSVWLLGILAWVVYITHHYTGNMFRAIVYIIVSILVSQVFYLLWLLEENKKIAQVNLAHTLEAEERLAARLRG